MKRPDGFAQAYNAQIALDTLQLIVGHAVTQETNDKKQFLPMIATIVQQSGEMPTQVLANAGYCSDANLAAIAALPIDAYISTRKQQHGEHPGPCPRGPLPPTATWVERMTRKFLTKAGAAVYARPQNDCRASPRADQSRTRLPSVPAARDDEGASRMVARLHYAQHSQVVSPQRLVDGSSKVEFSGRCGRVCR